GHRQVRDQVPDQHGDEERHSAHGGGTALRAVLPLHLFPDLLAEAVPGEDADQVGGEEDRHHQRHRGGDEDRLHAAPPPSPSSASATRHSPAEFDALASTTSPGRSSARSHATAASTSGTRVDSSPHDPSNEAAWCIHRACSPTTTTRSMFTRTARRPISSYASASACPSSAIGPSTAHARPGRPRVMAASVFRAARTDSGLAL